MSTRRAFGIAIAMHAAVAAALLAHAPAREALRATAPIMIELLSPPRPPEVQPAPVTELPKPKAVARRQLERALQPPPLVAAPVARSAVDSPTPTPAPPAPVAIASPPAPPAPAPIPTTQPIFDANYLENPPPPYPRIARRNGLQGRVVLRVMVSAAGIATEVQVRSTSGHEVLDDAARETVRGWRFVPAKRGDEPVAAWVLIPISFRLES